MARRKTIKVLLCNWYALFREGIKALLPEGAAIEIVGEAATAKPAGTFAARPGAAGSITPDCSGSELTRRIKAIDPDIEV